MSNPISEILSDEQYAALVDHGFLKSIAVRNREICRKFRNYKKCGVNSGQAINKLMDEYHLGKKTIERLVYPSK